MRLGSGGGERRQGGRGSHGATSDGAVRAARAGARAEKASNNTAELTALAEGLAYLREEEGTTGPAIVRPDSEYAMDIALGLSKPKKNASLALRKAAGDA